MVVTILIWSHLSGRGHDGPHTGRGGLLPVGRVLQEVIDVGEILPRTGNNLSALSRRFGHLLALLHHPGAAGGLLGDTGFLVLPVVLPVNLQLLWLLNILSLLWPTLLYLVNEVSLDVLESVLPSPATASVRTGLLRVLEAGVQLRAGLGLGGDEDDLELAALRHDLLLVDHDVAVVVGLQHRIGGPGVDILEVDPGALQVAEVEAGGALGSVPAVRWSVEIILDASNAGALAGVGCRASGQTVGSPRPPWVQISSKFPGIVVAVVATWGMFSQATSWNILVLIHWGAPQYDSKYTLISEGKTEIGSRK